MSCARVSGDCDDSRVALCPESRCEAEGLRAELSLAELGCEAVEEADCDAGEETTAVDSPIAISGGALRWGSWDRVSARVSVMT